jgi:RNA polymerase sigma-70 factor (ECF subfamily)
MEILAKVVLSLPERERVIFLLNRVEGISISDIARRTGLSISGVRLIIMRSMQKCQNALRKNGLS